jgi:hypothetical protein
MGEVIAQFVACLPDTAAALKVSGAGDGRLQLDVPESELAEVLKLIAFGRDCALRVTVERQ